MDLVGHLEYIPRPEMRKDYELLFKHSYTGFWSPTYRKHLEPLKQLACKQKTFCTGMCMCVCACMCVCVGGL